MWNRMHEGGRRPVEKVEEIYYLGEISKFLANLYLPVAHAQAGHHLLDQLGASWRALV